MSKQSKQSVTVTPDAAAPTLEKRDKPFISGLKFGAMEMSFWASMCVGSYITAYLTALGVSADKAGFLTSLASAVAIFSNFFWGMVSDKTNSVKKTYLITICISATLLLFIPTAANISIALLMVWWPLVCFFRTPPSTLMESWIVRGARRDGFNYGIARSGGSVGWFSAGILMSYILEKVSAKVGEATAYSYTFYASFAATMLVIVIAIITKDVKEPTTTGAKKSLRFRDMKFGDLFRNYYYIMLLLFALGLSMATNSASGFLSYLMKDAEVPITKLGYITGLRALMEIPMLWLMKPLRRKFPLYVLILIGGGLFATSLVLFGLSHSFWSLMMVGVVFGLGNGAVIAGSGNYVYSLAPDSLKATAQMIYGISTSIAGIIGNAVGGVIIANYGAHVFYRIFGLELFIVTALYAITFVIGKKVLHKPLPDNPNKE